MVLIILSETLEPLLLYETVFVAVLVGVLLPVYETVLVPDFVAVLLPVYETVGVSSTITMRLFFLGGTGSSIITGSTFGGRGYGITIGRFFWGT